MTRTLRWRIAFPYVLLVVVTMAGLSIFLLSLVRSTYQENLKTSLLAEARLVSENAAPLFASSDPTQQGNALAQRYAQALGVRITLITADGRVVGESDANSTEMENHLSRPEVHQALSGQAATSIRDSDTLNAAMLYAAVPIRSGGQIVGVARLAVSLSRLENSLSTIGNTIFAAALAAVVVAIFLSLLLTNYTIHPLQQLMEATRHMSAGDFSGTLIPTTHDELGQLTQAFNQMAAQLREQIEALQLEQGKLNAVLSNMTDGVLIVDAVGNVQLINPAAERLFEIRAQAALGRSLVEVVRHHQLVDLWRQCLETGEQQNTTLELSAEHLFLQGIATTLKQALPGSTLLLFQDLTRVRRLETIRQDFISNVSHELRTPLASLKALTETLQEGALEDPPAARRFLFRMETEIDTLTQMVHELLELSRIESGKVPFQRKPVDPCHLVTPAVERMRLQAERAGLSLRLECPEDLPMVSADASRIEQVLVNLLHNAIKFTPPGGEILVNCMSYSSQVTFAVQDTGVGIPGKDLTRIFERFYKADRARSGGGTGLGLSIAKHVVEAHDGRIWAESEPGKGSTFYFTLPIVSKS